MLPTNLTVGGRRDVLTTKSTLYKSPVMNKKTSEITNHQTHSKESSESDSGSSETSSSSTENTKKSTASTQTGKTDGKQTKKPASQWDMQPAAPTIQLSQPIAAVSVAVSSPPPAIEQTILHPPRDYSTLPELLGPPRQGDKLAFKVHCPLLRIFYYHCQE